MGECTTEDTDTLIDEIRERVTAGYGDFYAAVLDMAAGRIVARTAWAMGHECGMKQGLTPDAPRETHEDMTKHATRYITTTDWPNHYPWPTVGGLRNLIQGAEKNGFAAVIKRVGRRVLIDEAAFHRWVASGGES